MFKWNVMYLKEIREVLNDEKKARPTLIQERTYDALKNGESIVGLAKTGTGKTLAYGLPILERAREIGGLAVILEPTSELAVQTKNVLLPYVKALGLKSIALVGAGNRNRQMEQLKKEKPSILIATPGRLFDFISAKKINYQDIKALVIDEADDILEFAKLDLLSALGQNLSSDAQIILFGASESSITKNCETIFERSFFLIDVRSEQKLAVKHYFLQVSNEYKIQFLQRLTKLDKFKGLIFFSSNESQMRFARIVAHTKMRFAILNNEMDKTVQKNILTSFQKGKVNLLFVTDLIARGLDLSEVTYVVNFEIPDDANTYLHRSGRTGRMNNAGYVVNLGDDHDFRKLKKMIAPVEVKQVYFKGYQLVTEKPLQKAKDKKVVSMSETKKKGKKKNRWKKQKNKGYHAKKQDK